MPKGQQRSNKEVKKPKKDKTAVSPSTPPRPPAIVVPDRQKNK